MTLYGVQKEGFVDKPIEVSLQEIEDAQKAKFGVGFNVSAQEPQGQLNGIYVTKIREFWEVLQAVYNSIDPDKAADQALNRVSALTGTVKLPATKSTVTARVNLDAGTLVETGAVISVTGDPTARFVTLADVENTGGSPADFTVTTEAETAGVVVANAGTLQVIETAVSGWNSSTNDADAVIGLTAEGNEALRIRREEELRVSGAGALDAIKADLVKVSGVTSVVMFENTKDTVSADGLPPHSIEAVVQGGTDAAVTQQVWKSKGGGVEAHGNTSGTATDVDGNSRSVKYTRPTNVDVYLDFFVTANTDPLLGPVYPADGDAQLKAAVVSFFQQSQDSGEDVILSQLVAPGFSVDGVTDVSSIEAGFAASPSGTANLPISPRNIAFTEAAKITVTVA